MPNKHTIYPLAGTATVAVLLIVGASAIKQHRDAQMEAQPWLKDRLAMEDPRDKVTRQQQRAVYECVLRNSSRMGNDRSTLHQMCDEFPDLR